ncbi:16S rRNA (guanine(966)-N(2))-methyltransferase RsmD [Chryseomicrobium sp. FSL W7-1435]|uniref:16S rRNA (guanine(966)-N(2))-methyltransferase RsmD n=1 Tax=Chryseomicrobium sp. FSL W7-1435 TaxID=2921704 RepID=UPI00315A568A
MRIVSGTRKSIPLKALPGEATRPTTDKVKESLFNILGPYFDGEHVLDLFAGSGGLGLEALSRGASHALFVEKNGKAVQVIKENIDKTRFSDQAELYKIDAKYAIERMVQEQKSFDLVFFDPPYAQVQLYGLANALFEKGLIAKDGIVVCEHDRKQDIEHLIPLATCYRKEVYGSLAISFFEQTTSI